MLLMEVARLDFNWIYLRPRIIMLPAIPTMASRTTAMITSNNIARPDAVEGTECVTGSGRMPDWSVEWEVSS